MSTTVTYKGSTITTVNNQTRVLNTAGKWLEGDITLTDVSSSGGGGMTVTDVSNANGTGTVVTGDAAILTTKSITENGTYAASSDSADGYSSVTVAVPTGITPTGTKNISITENGTVTEDVTNYANAQITVNIPPPTVFVPNVQIAQGVNRIAATSYTAVSGQTITVAKTGKYDVYWTGFRSSTTGTNKSCLYVNGSAHSSGDQATFSNNAQSVKLTGVSLTKDDVLTVRAISRGANYYMYVGNLTIVQTE